MWSCKYDSCIRCGRTECRHEGHGLCSKCYYMDYRIENKKKISEWMNNFMEKNRYNKDFLKRRAKAVMIYYNKNRAKELVAMKKYREENPERFARYKITYPSARPKRSQEYWQNRYHLIFELGKGCVICGSKEHPHIHHIIPESQGGSHSLINLDVYCKNCHLGSNLHLGLHGGGGENR